MSWQKNAALVTSAMATMSAWCASITGANRVATPTYSRIAIVAEFPQALGKLGRAL
jgi:hypothetical protein